MPFKQLKDKEELTELRKAIIQISQKTKERNFKEEKYQWILNEEGNKYVLHYKETDSNKFISTNHEMPILP